MHRLTSHEVFFPAASLYAAIVLPWSVLAIIGVVAGPAPLQTPMDHAHEMLLGCALAVVAGYQLPPISGRRLALPFMLWLLARIAYVAGRVQPRIEGALLALMAIAIAAAVVPALDPLLRAACVAAGVLALVRLLRWRLWQCRGRPDLLCLGAGYAWLAIGLTALGLAPPGALRTGAIHLITVGAIGR